MSDYFTRFIQLANNQQEKIEPKPMTLFDPEIKLKSQRAQDILSGVTWRDLQRKPKPNSIRDGLIDE